MYIDIIMTISCENHENFEMPFSDHLLTELLNLFISDCDL